MDVNKTIAHYEEKGLFNYRHSVSEDPGTFRIHIHDYYELFYFISGDMTYYIEGQTYEMNSGDILIMNSDELHRPVHKPGVPYERIVIHFYNKYVTNFDKDGLQLLHFLTKRKLGHSNRIDSSKFDTKPIYNQIKRIGEISQENTPYSHMLVKTYFIQLLIDLNKIYSNEDQSIITPKHYDERVSAILAYLNDNIDKKITLADLEKRFYINKYHLCHIFKKNTGFTVFEYINNKRIMKAKQLLTEGMTVIDTCYSVGFSDYSNFYKAFKRLAGVPPKKFALQN